MSIKMLPFEIRTLKFIVKLNPEEQEKLNEAIKQLLKRVSERDRRFPRLEAQ